MKMESRCFQLHILRAPLSFFIALVLLFATPMQVEAAGITSAFASDKIAYLYPDQIYTGSPAVSTTYSGSYTMTIRLVFDSSQAHNYIYGVYSYWVSFSVASTSLPPSSNYFSNGFTASLSSIEHPDGLTVVYIPADHNVSSSGGTLFFYFENFYVYNGELFVSLTFDLMYGVHGSQNSVPINNVRSVTVNVLGSPGSDWTAILPSWTDVTPFYKWIFNAVNLVNTQLGNIFTAVTNQTDLLRERLTTINTSINTQGKNITDKLQSQINNDNSNTTKITNAINAASKAEIDAANKNSQAEINAANKNADDIMHDYDTSSQDSDNKKFDDAQKELQEVEDNLFGQAVSGFDALDMSNYNISHLTTVLPAFSFVSGFLQSLYVKMGDFGVIVTVGLVVMIASKVIGLYRFSTGGDSS